MAIPFVVPLQVAFDAVAYSRRRTREKKKLSGRSERRSCRRPHTRRSWASGKTDAGSLGRASRLLARWRWRLSQKGVGLLVGRFRLLFALCLLATPR